MNVTARELLVGLVVWAVSLVFFLSAIKAFPATVPPMPGPVTKPAAVIVQPPSPATTNQVGLTWTGCPWANFYTIWASCDSLTNWDIVAVTDTNIALFDLVYSNCYFLSVEADRVP
jgi:hypothetical protein